MINALFFIWINIIIINIYNSEITKITCAPSKGDDKHDDEKSWDGMDGDEVDTSRTTEVAGNKSNNNTNCNPRELLTKHHQRDGESGSYRYAIKYLKEEIRSSPQKYAVGTADLVVEGMFLASSIARSMSRRCVDLSPPASRMINSPSRSVKYTR